MTTNEKAVKIEIEAKILDEGNHRKVGYIHYKHDEHPGYDILAVLTQVMAETMVKAKPPKADDNEWTLDVLRLQANALHSALAARLAGMGE